jgi:hypothetical protein
MSEKLSERNENGIIVLLANKSERTDEARAMSAELALEELMNVKLRSTGESVAKLARLTWLCAGSDRIWQHIDGIRELWECIEQSSPEVRERFRWVDGYSVAIDIFLNNLLTILELEKPSYIPPDFPRPRNINGLHYVRSSRTYDRPQPSPEHGRPSVTIPFRKVR